MATHIKRLRGNTEQNDVYVGVDGELTVNQDSNSIRVHDGVKEGGYGTVNAMHYPTELPEQVPIDLATGAHVTAGDGRLEGGTNAPYTYADDTRVVHRTGNETILGEKLFQNKVVSPTPEATSNDNTVATTAFVRKHTEPDLTAERSVGTVFNTPAYEKTFSFMTPNRTWQDEEVLDLSGLNIGEVISITASVRDTSQAFVSVPYVTAGRSVAITGYVYQKKSYRVTVFEDSFLYRKGFITIRYTKDV